MNVPSVTGDLTTQALLKVLVPSSLDASNLGCYDCVLLLTLAVSRTPVSFFRFLSVDWRRQFRTNLIAARDSSSSLTSYFVTTFQTEKTEKVLLLFKKRRLFFSRSFDLPVLRACSNVGSKKKQFLSQGTLHRDCREYRRNLKDGASSFVWQFKSDC